MIKIIGTKVNMTQVWKNDVVVPVTIIKFAPEVDIRGLTEDAFVKVSGISKGHGFAGVVKRHSFHGGPKTHGQKNRFRAPGSIGSTAPQRVTPGRKMAGRMGGVRVTVRNLKVVAVHPETKEVLLRGAVPGAKKGKVEIVV